MGAPPSLENGHSTTAITEESHHTRVQMSSALDSVSEDSELEGGPAPVGKYIYEDQEVATSDQVQSSDAAGHKEAEIQAPVVGNGQMWEDVIPSSEQELLMLAGKEEECEESSTSNPGAAIWWEPSSRPPISHFSHRKRDSTTQGHCRGPD